MEIISYSIQVVLQQETKSCSLASICFLELLKNLRECFLDQFDEKMIQYIDDEGDLVVFSTTEELELALKLTPNILRIVLQKKSTPEVPIPVRWIPKDKRPKKRRHENDPREEILPLNIEELQIDERQRNKKFRGIAKPENITNIQPNEPWPAQYQRIFIDGNNLMFMSSGLRKMTLQHRKRETEQTITGIAESFAEVIKITAIVMFDGTPTNFTKNYANGSVVIVTSAKPEFPTTDQALISWGKSNANCVGNTIVVTSDRALTGELISIGMSICKPSSWLKYVMRMFTMDENLDFRNWIDGRIGNL